MAPAMELQKVGPVDAGEVFDWASAEREVLPPAPGPAEDNGEARSNRVVLDPLQDPPRPPHAE